MPRWTVVLASELGGCWSAARFLNQCRNCDRLETCKLPESAKPRAFARMHRAGLRVLKAQADLLMAQAVYEERYKEFKDASGK